LSRLVVLFLLAAGACAADDNTPPVPMADPCTPVVLVAAAGTTDAERASLLDAADLWKAVAAVQIGVGVTEGALDGATVIPVRFLSAPLAFLGAYEEEQKDVVVNSEIPDEPTRAIVLAHELGHAFGMAHIAGRPSVMNASNSTVAPNAADAAALAGIWGTCPP
jgi:hypothetical protein